MLLSIKTIILRNAISAAVKHRFLMQTLKSRNPGDCIAGAKHSTNECLGSLNQNRDSRLRWRDLRLEYCNEVSLLMKSKNGRSASKENTRLE